MRYLEYLQPLIGQDGRLNDILRLQNGRILFADTLDLLEISRQHGAPLEIAFCPLITRRVQAMQGYAAAAAARTGYQGQFVYAYATKANFVEEVVRTAIEAGAHYETSSAFDVRIAHRLWKTGLLPSNRFVFCNGSKEQPYLDAMLDLRRAGFTNVVPILDDPYEFEALASCPEPLLLGVRERKDPQDLTEGITYGYDRFGLLPDEMQTLGERIAQTQHQLMLYHAMVGSQIEDSALFMHEIRESLDGYTRLRSQVDSLAYFNIGGGVPTGAYSLAFNFNYQQFIEALLHEIGAWSAEHSMPQPHLVGEFGRYTCADYGIHIFRVGRTKRGQPNEPLWYLLDGSLMVALPDILIVEDQEFIVLPLNHLERESVPVVLGGRRTCDSDDFYPRSSKPPLILPQFDSLQGDEPLLLAFFGTGAYQAMLSGEGGAHHCLAPEAPKLIFEQRNGTLSTRVIGGQSWEDVLSELGY